MSGDSLVDERVIMDDQLSSLFRGEFVLMSVVAGDQCCSYPLTLSDAHMSTSVRVRVMRVSPCDADSV